jgi:hypothetical protein
METELDSETLVFDLALMQLNARENFITLIRHESLKSYKAACLIIFILQYGKN